MQSGILKNTQIQIEISTVVWLGRDVCQIQGPHKIESRGLSAKLGLLGEPLGPLWILKTENVGHDLLNNPSKLVFLVRVLLLEKTWVFIYWGSK